MLAECLQIERLHGEWLVLMCCDASIFSRSFLQRRRRDDIDWRPLTGIPVLLSGTRASFFLSLPCFHNAIICPKPYSDYSDQLLRPVSLEHLMLKQLRSLRIKPALFQ